VSCLVSSCGNRASGRFDDCLDWLKERLADPTGDRICESLRIAREVGDTDKLSVHPLVHAFARDRLGDAEARKWSDVAVRLVASAFPYLYRDLSTWPQAAALFRHVFAAVHHATSLSVALEECPPLLVAAGNYLHLMASSRRPARYSCRRWRLPKPNMGSITPKC
jgi:hypothetical protein